MATVHKTTVNQWKTSKKDGGDIVGMYIQYLCNRFSFEVQSVGSWLSLFRQYCFIWFHAFLICIPLAKNVMVCKKYCLMLH